jgi:O-succinylbenzoic acid--CoA ligase
VNVSLDRVEAAVRGIAGLESAVVVPVADATWGQGSAVVVPRPTPAADAELLERVRAVVADAVGAPARPSRLVVVDELPTLSSGKPDRAAARALLAQDPRG